MVSDTNKLRIINIIDEISDYLTNSIYYTELKMMRKKYIYKDISTADYNLDMKYLSNLIDLIYLHHHNQKTLRSNYDICE